MPRQEEAESDRHLGGPDATQAPEDSVVRSFGSAKVANGTLLFSAGTSHTIAAALRRKYRLL